MNVFKQLIEAITKNNTKIDLLIIDDHYMILPSKMYKFSCANFDDNVGKTLIYTVKEDHNEIIVNNQFFDLHNSTSIDDIENVINDGINHLMDVLKMYDT